MSSNVSSYLKYLFDEFEREANRHISDFLNDLKEITNTITALLARPRSLSKSLCLELAEMINLRIFSVKEIIIKWLSVDFKNDVLSEIKKVLQIHQSSGSDHANKSQKDNGGDPKLFSGVSSKMNIDNASVAGTDKVDPSSNNKHSDDEKSLLKILDSAKEEFPGGRTIERKSVIFYKLPPMKIPCPDTLIHLLVTHIAHPTLFCGLHVQSRFARTGQFENAMAFADYMNSPSMVGKYQNLTREPVVDELLIAPFDDDGCYYRAKVVESKEHGYTKVVFIDYGNSAEVRTEDLREMVPELTDIPVQAVTCSLADVNTDIREKQDFGQGLVDKWNSLLLDSVVTCKVVGNQGEVLNVLANLECLDITKYLHMLVLEETSDRNTTK